jgi:hypothetical protein
MTKYSHHFWLVSSHGIDVKLSIASHFREMDITFLKVAAYNITL